MDTLFLLLCTAVASLALQGLPGLAFTYPGRTLQGGSATCPSSEQTEMIRGEIDEDLQIILQQVVAPARPCGGEGWRVIAYLNMSAPAERCPSNWRQYNNNGRRACARVDYGGGCNQVSFITSGLPYNQVCGRIIGYQYGGPEAFRDADNSTIDTNYVDGVSVTHGSPRQHIWTFAGGLRQDARCTLCACPCDQGSVSAAVVPPFVGQNYFCESGVTSFNGSTILYTDNPLWDGQGCGPTSTCCSFHSPPWFSVQLPSPTTDDIDVRTCSSSHDQKLTPVELIEIYVK